MPGGNPRIPEFVEDRAVCLFRDVDEHLQKPHPVAPDRLQRRVDLGEHLSDLAPGIERHVLGDLDPVRDATMHHDVNP